MRHLVVLFFLSACNVSAFDQFGFVTAPDLGLGGSDLASVTSDAGARGQLGAACTGTSTSSTCASIWTCFTDAQWTDGMCSNVCSPADPTACGLDGACKTVGTQSVCLVKCGPVNKCRNGYDCCDGQGTTLAAGNCAPKDSHFCGK